MKLSHESGSHVVALALGLVVLAVVGFAGYRVWTMQQAAAPVSDATTATVPAKITNTATLKQAAAVLDQSASQLNTGLDDSALNTDLNDML